MYGVHIDAMCCHENFDMLYARSLGQGIDYVLRSTNISFLIVFVVDADTHRSEVLYHHEEFAGTCTSWMASTRQQFVFLLSLPARAVFEAAGTRIRHPSISSRLFQTYHRISSMTPQVPTRIIARRVKDFHLSSQKQLY